MRYDEGKFVIVKPARYDMIVENAFGGTAKGSNNPVLKVKFRIVTPGDFQEVEIEKSLPGFMVCKLAKALGVPAKEDNGKRYYDVDGVDVIGKYVSSTINNKVYNGKDYNELVGDFEAATPAAGDEIPF